MAKQLSSDREWEKFGSTDPYFGVSSAEQFKTKNLTSDSLNAFFESGHAHINHVLAQFDRIRKSEITQLDTVLDFGCGTGRLLLPLASRSNRAVGIDVSQSMLSEAANNLKRWNLEHVELIHANSPEVLGNRQFDLVHTYIVLQHIPVQAGYKIINALLAAIRPGGMGMIHFPYRNEQSWVQNLGRRVKTRFKWAVKATNLLRSRPLSAPFMQMNEYDLKKVFKMLEDQQIESCYAEFTNHGGFHGICLYLTKRGGDPGRA